MSISVQLSSKQVLFNLLKKLKNQDFFEKLHLDFQYAIDEDVVNKMCSLEALVKLTITTTNNGNVGILSLLVELKKLVLKTQVASIGLIAEWKYISIGQLLMILHTLVSDQKVYR